MIDLSPHTKVVNDVKIEPKYLPFRCPVCNGFGTLKNGELTCHACNGKGYVVISNRDREESWKTKDL